jgi:hypothetical protein
MRFEYHREGEKEKAGSGFEQELKSIGESFDFFPDFEEEGKNIQQSLAKKPEREAEQEAYAVVGEVESQSVRAEAAEKKKRGRSTRASQFAFAGSPFSPYGRMTTRLG